MSDCKQCANKDACWIFSKHRMEVNKGYGCQGYVDATKPVITHCYNCRYSEKLFTEYKCTVKYKLTTMPRIRALLCKYYKRKGGADNG